MCVGGVLGKSSLEAYTLLFAFAGGCIARRREETRDRLLLEGTKKWLIGCQETEAR